MVEKSTMRALGMHAPPFDLPDPRGVRHRLNEPSGAPATLVAFISNHCPYVRHIAPTFAEVTGRMIDAGIDVFAIGSNDIRFYPDDGPDQMAVFSDEQGFRFPYLFDADQSVAMSYGAACTPDLFLFDRDLSLVYRGRFDRSTPGNGEPCTGEDLWAAVEAVLAGERPSTEQYPSMGCSIKWRRDMSTA